MKDDSGKKQLAKVVTAIFCLSALALCASVITACMRTEPL